MFQTTNRSSRAKMGILAMILDMPYGDLILFADELSIAL